MSGSPCDFRIAAGQGIVLLLRWRRSVSLVLGWVMNDSPWDPLSQLNPSVLASCEASKSRLQMKPWMN